MKFIIAVLLLFSISNVVAQVQNNLGTDPIRLEKKITRFMSDSVLVEDSLQFEYDGQGRIITLIDMKTGNARKRLSYENGLLKTITNYDTQGKISGSFDGRYKETPNKDKITLDFSKTDADGVITDTILVTYEFKSSAIAKIGIYVHLTGLPFSYDKRIYKYDGEGRLTSLRQVNSNEDTASVVRVLEWDNRKNPFAEMLPTNYILLANDFPFNIQGVNNPIKYIDVLGNTIVTEVTYNEEGYPLTYKKQGESFVADELIYNR